MKIKNIVFAVLLVTGLVLHASDITVAAGYDWQASQALFEAIKKNDIEAVKKALGSGADCNAKSKNGDTALHLAAINKAADIAKVLIEHGADVNAQNRYGNTALHLAAINNAADVAKWLIGHGTDLPTNLSRAKELLNQVIEEINTERQQKIEDALQAFKRGREKQINKKMPLELLNKIANFANPDLLPSATEISIDPVQKALADQIQANVRSDVLRVRQQRTIDALRSFKFIQNSNRPMLWQLRDTIARLAVGNLEPISLIE